MLTNSRATTEKKIIHRGLFREKRIGHINGGIFARRISISNVLMDQFYIKWRKPQRHKGHKDFFKFLFLLCAFVVFILSFHVNLSLGGLKMPEIECQELSKD